MNIQNGDVILFFDRSYKGTPPKYYDAGLAEVDGDSISILRFYPFLGGIRPSPMCTETNFDVYRYTGEDALKVQQVALAWFQRWLGTPYRWSSRLWIPLSRLPLFGCWLGVSNDKLKVKADKGFIGSTAVAWAFECAGVDLVPYRSPDLTSVSDLARCPLLQKVEGGG